MKLHLPGKLLTAVLTSFLGIAHGTTVTGPDYSYSYRGGDYIATKTSATETTTTLVVNLDKLQQAAQNSSSTKGESNDNYLLGWLSNKGTYGLVATKDGIKAAVNAASIVWNDDRNSTLAYETLKKYADGEGNVSLTITNTTGSGVTISYSKGDDSNYTNWAGLLYSGYNTTYKYYFNSDFVNSVALDADSTKLDNLTPFVQQNEGAPSIGRVLFAGDSITHGINESTWRWQLFKSLTDNGIENEITGPKTGYSTSHSYRTDGVQLNITSDAGQKEGLDVATEQYGNATFNNAHLAQASGRVRNMLAGIGVSGGVVGHLSNGYSYGGEQYAAEYVTGVNNYDTVVCLIGTNDLLSDNGHTHANMSSKIKTLLGGSVTGDDYTWSRTVDDSWGSMGELINALLPDKQNDQLYLMTIPVWYKDVSDAAVTQHAVKQYNKNYAQWVNAYNAAHSTNIKLVNINRGLEDVATNQYKGHLDFFYNATDGLHPNEQGSLIIAGNLAQAMNIGGRTAGLERQAVNHNWESATIAPVIGAAYQIVAENAFTMANGYTIDFSANFGNGFADKVWDTNSTMSISLGDGTNSGTLTLSEGYITWQNTNNGQTNSQVLFCWDNSALAQEGNLRIAWHNGNAEDNVLGGYYVWLGDMLIGQGLDATTDTGLNGILFSNAGTATGTITNLSWIDTAYAPTTTRDYSAEYAYKTIQDNASVTDRITNTYSPTFSDVDFSNIAETAASAGSALITSDSTAEAKNIKLTSAAGWTAVTNCSRDEIINVQVAGTTEMTIFGALNLNKNTPITVNTVNLVVADNAQIKYGQFGNINSSIVGIFDYANLKAFNVYVEGGNVAHNIIGGSVRNTGSVGAVKIAVTGGTVDGNISGGSEGDATAETSVGSASIIIAGGTVKGDIIAGGNKGKIGNTHVIISGGTIDGDITKGNATRMTGAQSYVTIQGNAGNIKGSIDSDVLTLVDVKKDVVATLNTVNKLHVSGSTQTGAIMGETANVDSLILEDGTCFSAFKSSSSLITDSISETTLSISTLQVGKNATLNANLVFSADSSLIMSGSLTMGSDVSLSSGMSLTLSDDMLNALYGEASLVLFTGVDSLFLDGQNVAQGAMVDANGVFTNLDANNNYFLSYTANGTVSLMSVPEPATVTLSLSALFALCARRRRKS